MLKAKEFTLCCLLLIALLYTSAKQPLHRDDPGQQLEDAEVSDPMCRMRSETNGVTKWSVDDNEHGGGEGCPRRWSVRCNKKFGRALVINMLHTKKAKQVQHEFWNFDHFVRNAVRRQNESTAMFDRVDYVFIRIRPPHQNQSTEVELCAEFENVKLLWLPPTPCDLCGHSRVFHYLGGFEAVKEKYAFITVLNAGTRGPFQNSEDADWIDVLAMGGQSTLIKNDSAPSILSAVSVSPIMRIHGSSNFLGFHTWRMAFPVLFRQYAKACKGDWLYCGIGGELDSGAILLKKGVWLHSLTRNLTVRSMADVGMLEREATSRFGDKVGKLYPFNQPFDVCASIFFKHGGNFLHLIEESAVVQMTQLTVLQQPQQRRRRTNVISEMLTDERNSQCQWLML